MSLQKFFADLKQRGASNYTPLDDHFNVHVCATHNALDEIKNLEQKIVDSNEAIRDALFIKFKEENWYKGHKSSLECTITDCNGKGTTLLNAICGELARTVEGFHGKTDRELKFQYGQGQGYTLTNAEISAGKMDIVREGHFVVAPDIKVLNIALKKIGVEIILHNFKPSYINVSIKILVD